MTPLHFFLFVTRWVAAIFGTLGAAVGIVLFIIAIVYEIREGLFKVRA